MAPPSYDPTNDTRPWWRKKTNWGLGLYVIGEGISKLPVSNPWLTFTGWVLITGGTFLAGYGISDRISKK